MPNTTKAEFASTVNPDESHETALDLQCLPSSLLVFNMIHVQFEMKVFGNSADIIL